ncbi:MAG: aminotransferase class I/II-fold pyridoxal phosphate-dependent enzyme [Pseudomonadota bacterium]
MTGSKKNGIHDLALFGGARLFDTPRPIGQLAAPHVEEYLALVRQAFEAGQLSAHGQLEQQLEAELAAYHGVRHCIALANAALGLMMLAKHFAQDRHGEVIMPAFSFRGLPHFVQWAGQMPRFCDVDRHSHTLDLGSVERAINKRTTSIMSVCNFNSPGNIDGLCQLADEHDLPLYFDSVYAVGCTYRGKKLGGFGAAEVYSLHATKLLNGFEGGYVTTDDDGLADKLRRLRDGAINDEDFPGLALNARLNELHAAMGLLSLQQIDTIIAGNRRRFDSYLRAVEHVPGLSLISYPDASQEESNYEMAVLEIDSAFPLSRNQLMNLVRAEGLAISAYYSPALHLSEHCPKGLKIDSLPTTEWLAGRYLQLPVGELVSLADIGFIGELLGFVYEHGTAIADRLREQGVE